MTETDPNGIPPHEPGSKLDAGKIQAGILASFGNALEAMMKVASFGAEKYTRDGFLEVPNGKQRYHDAAMRHYLAMAREELDPESGLPHLWHVLWNFAAMIEVGIRQELTNAGQTAQAHEAIAEPKEESYLEIVKKAAMENPWRFPPERPSGPLHTDPPQQIPSRRCPQDYEYILIQEQSAGSQAQ